MCKYLKLQVDFASWNYPFRKLQKSPATHELSIQQWFISLFYFASCENLASWIPQLAKLLYGWFLLCLSSLHPCLDFAKGYEAPKLSFFMNLSFNSVCLDLYIDLPHSWIALVIKKLSKTPKLNTIWLKMIARVLNVPLELKGNNYYLKVFKRVNYKL